MRKSVLTLAIATAVVTIATAASAQTSTSPTGPAFSTRFFTTALENDPSRVVQMQMQLHLPNRPGNGFHTHNGDQWEAVIEGEITFTVKGQPQRDRPGNSSTSRAAPSIATRTRAISQPAPWNF
jgi:quercetin dioxygenase-like cupin family protein